MLKKQHEEKPYERGRWNLLRSLYYGAPGGIRTPVAARALGLQPSAIDHSATDADS